MKTKIKSQPKLKKAVLKLQFKNWQKLNLLIFRPIPYKNLKIKMPENCLKGILWFTLYTKKSVKELYGACK